MFHKSAPKAGNLLGMAAPLSITGINEPHPAVCVTDTSHMLRITCGTWHMITTREPRTGVAQHLVCTCRSLIPPSSLVKGLSAGER